MKGAPGAPPGRNRKARRTGKRRGVSPACAPVLVEGGGNDYARELLESLPRLGPFHIPTTADRSRINRSRQRRLRPLDRPQLNAIAIAPAPSRQVGRYGAKVLEHGRRIASLPTVRRRAHSKCRTRDAARHRRFAFGSGTRLNQSDTSDLLRACACAYGEAKNEVAMRGARKSVRRLDPTPRLAAHAQST